MTKNRLLNKFPCYMRRFSKTAVYWSKWPKTGGGRKLGVIPYAYSFSSYGRAKRTNTHVFVFVLFCFFLSFLVIEKLC